VTAPDMTKRRIPGRMSRKSPEREERMRDELLLVGSIPLDTSEQVFNAFAPALGDWLAYLPDGEVGDRRYWIDGIAYRVLNGHPEIETLQRPAPDADGVEQWRPRGIHDQFRFRVKPGVDRVRFGDPGWRLLYTRDAINSYFVFRRLKQDGIIPGHVRFQVCMPLTYSAVGSFFPDPEDLKKVVPGMTAALKAETAEIVRHIPAAELTIQWDLAIENRIIEVALAEHGIDAARDAAKRIAEPLDEICEIIPPEVALGHHACFGTLNGWPSRQPADMTGNTVMLNAVCAAGGHKVDFIHFPTIASADDDYFRPFEDLDSGDARVYVGAIHHMHGDGMRRQLEAIRAYIPDFGLAAPCGFGRAPERPGRLLSEQGDGPPPDYIQIILDDHKKAVETLHEVLD
jgi:hypothetical protein